MIKSIITFFALLFITTPQAEKITYTLDKAHTFIEFRVNRFMVGEVSGKFKEFDGSITFEEDNPETMNMDITIKTASLDTDHAERDSHLRSKIWLDAESYPTIQFKSKEVKKSGENYLVKGDLTIHGKTNEVEFPFSFQGPFKDPTGTVTIGLSGELTINRQDYGIQFSRLMDNGELFIGNEVKIKLQALAMKKKVTK